MSTQTGPRPSDKWIPWSIVLFFVMLTVFFGWFYHIASSSFTGVVTDGAYEKGLQYNNVIAAVEAQEERGWSSTFLKKDGGIYFSLKDKNGEAVSGASVHLWLIRPVHDGIDQHMEMTETTPGVYFSPVQLPERGLWEVRVDAEKQGQGYQTSKRVEF